MSRLVETRPAPLKVGGGPTWLMGMVDTRHETIGTEQARYPELTRTQYKYKHTVDRKTQTNGMNYGK